MKKGKEFRRRKGRDGGTRYLLKTVIGLLIFFYIVGLIVGPETQKLEKSKLLQEKQPGKLVREPEPEPDLKDPTDEKARKAGALIKHVGSTIALGITFIAKVALDVFNWPETGMDKEIREKNDEKPTAPPGKDTAYPAN